MRYTHQEFLKDMEVLAHKLPSDKYSAIYGVPRGGIPIAMELSHLTGIPYIVEPMTAAHHDPSKVLVVDDLIASGATRNRFKDHPFATIHINPVGIKTNTVHKKPFSDCAPTFWLRAASEWIDYWWEYTGSRPETVEDNIIRILQYLGEDTSREGLVETPRRVVESYSELFSGYKKDPSSLFKLFSEEKHDQIVICKNIEMYSTCEHHMQPFYGKAHIAYIPNEKGEVVGLSKLPRLLEIFSRRLQIQERIGTQVTKAMEEGLNNPKATACIITAKHLCVCARGVGKQDSEMVTSSVTGLFRDPDVKSELFSLLAG